MRLLGEVLLGEPEGQGGVNLNEMRAAPLREGWHTVYRKHERILIMSSHSKKTPTRKARDY